ncbi:PgsA Phosphatidylglycerophosphate synthase [Rhabdaerophilaceae bacterium]
MLDSVLRPKIDPPLAFLAGWFASIGVHANHVTFIGLALGLGAAAAIAWEKMALGLVLILASRLADGLDGAIARINGKTEFGGYLDIMADFTFYAAIPVAFAVAIPSAQWPALLLVASFLLSGTSFMAAALVAKSQGWETRAQGEKSFYYLAGLAEGTETIVFFVAFCIFPDWFSTLASIFAGLCLLTALGRTLVVRSMLGRPE